MATYKIRLFLSREVGRRNYEALSPFTSMPLCIERGGGASSSSSMHRSSRELPRGLPENRVIGIL